MTTLVGTQTEFHEALYALCELDYDAMEAYQAAINRLEDQHFKEALAAYKADHQRHIDEVTELLKKHQKDYPDGPSAKQVLTQGKVVLAEMMGDKAILKAMLSNEEDTNSAYAKINSHENIWPEAKEILARGLADEKRHKQGIEKLIQNS